MEKNKKDKLILASLIASFALCLSGGIIGALNVSEARVEEPHEYKIKKLYYIDNMEVDTKPINPEDEILYVHDDDKLTCTNNVVAIWDNDLWDIKIPNPETDTTCSIYFTSTTAEVEFNITNGALENANIENNNVVKTKKNEDLIQKINPTEGYKFASVKCTNDEETSWNSTTNELTIKNIQSDTKCEVIFSISTFELKLLVSNGNGATTKTYDFESPVVLNVIPNNGYNSPEVSCTNGQTGTWNNNEFKIEKLTSDTSCSIQFKKLDYTVTVVVAGGEISERSKRVEYDSNASFTISPYSGYSVSVQSNSCPNNTVTAKDGKVLLTLNNVKSDITCDITLATAPTIQTNE